MSAFYNKGKSEFMKGNIDLENDTIKIAFMKPSHTPDIDAHEYYDDISADIASGSTDQTLASPSVAVDNTNNRAEFDATDISLSAQTIVGGTDMVIVYKDTGTPSTSVLICYIDIVEGTLTPVNGSLSITWDSEGILSF